MVSSITADEVRFKLMFEGSYISYRDFVPEGVKWADILDD